ncbi:Light-harvesting complex stress-related protein 1, chloroplastic [Cymbomonas tetramitiformis]|uniref:Chlorophyll a-b binding protein, chloroplastic n=1 Tax=Cymbomonas tetramitiformis TaxID=36881 RepID=A0AAE0EYV8_9CHLO|nr:Light-harvesting complex stress-related protein 1, chloroplastic [Cymbomonas tetramitiformis]KAK3245257.1 Light-harvesting complex stress-related protein 1, chloroplastic [Cymbomonas tetramitiformis]KAK3279695.1 Light-harvesting complex stress-related protein 1, chloroplastic [Cymbomonas tetramitiformis]
MAAVSTVFSRTALVIKAMTKTETKLPKTTQGPGQQYLSTLPGVSAPFYKEPWDPAGLVTEYTSVGDVKRWREAEVTHGRVAMLAALGFIVGENIEDFPLWGGVVQGPAVTQFQQLPRGFWELLILAIGIAESYRVAIGWAYPTGAGFNQLKEEYNPGDLGFDPLGLRPTDPMELKELQTKELNNGRLAMVAISGFVAQEFVGPGGPKEIFEHLFSVLGKDVSYEILKTEEAFEAFERAG